jgi:hypothetical protein
MHVMSRNLSVDAVLFNLDGALLITSASIANTPRRALIDNETIRGRPDGQLAKLCPGVEASLDGLRQMGLKLGIVTNGGTCDVSTLLQRSGLSAWFDIVVDGDTLDARKPDPAPLLHVCKRCARGRARACAECRRLRERRDGRTGGWHVNGLREPWLPHRSCCFGPAVPASDRRSQRITRTHRRTDAVAPTETVDASRA